MKKKKILVLENEIRESLRLKRVLGAEEYDFSDARNSQEAFALLEHMADQKDGPDLGIFDIKLEENLTGIDVASKILDDYPMPIVFLTDSFDNPKYLKKVLAIGIKATSFIDKNSVNKNEDWFREVIREIFDEYYRPSQKEGHVGGRASKELPVAILTQSKPYFTYRFLKKDEILFLEGDSRWGTRVHLIDGHEINISGNIGFIASQICSYYEHFVQPSTSYVVNLENIYSWEDSFLYFKDLNQEKGKRITMPKKNLVDAILFVKAKPPLK